MTKSELVENLMQKLRHLSKVEIEIIVDTVFHKMREALKKHNRIELRGFGIFEVRFRKARKGRNPKTGQNVNVQDRYVPFFKVGKELKERVNRLKVIREAKQTLPTKKVTTPVDVAL